MTLNPDSTSKTIEIVDGRAYRRCRLGHLHPVGAVGFAADYEFHQHNCDHERPLILTFLEQGQGQAICGLCGRAWAVDDKRVEGAT